MVARIVAGAVGFIPAPGGTLRAGIAVRESISLCRRPARPRFCYLGTAAEDPLSAPRPCTARCASSERSSPH
jgi:hypothetical protein